ncbi:MAG: extracellular solute-binding protein [Candidatus Binatia bacterium]
MRRLLFANILGVTLLFFSAAIASAIDVPKWWLGDKGEYEKLVKAAKKEGKVVWWSHPDPECKPLVAGPFEKRYGIQVEHTEYRTAQIVQRVLLEGQAGIYTVDVSNLSVHHVPRLEKKGLLKKLPYQRKVSTYRDVPELLSPNSTAYIGYTSPRSLAYNTKKVPKDQLPRTYEQVLNPRYKGKIAVDTDLKEYIILAQAWGLEKTQDYIKRLGKLKPKFHRSNSVITQMVAAGEAYLAPGIIGRIPIYEFKAKGAPIDWIALEPNVPLDLLLMGVMANAPHPNAAKLYAYWMHGSPEWLNGMDKCSGYGNALVPGNHLQEKLKDMKLVPFDWEWGVKSAKEGLGEKFRQIIGVE